MTTVNCPGHCGRTYAHENPDDTLRAIATHIQHCPRGHAIIEQLRQFARWLDQDMFPDHWDTETHPDELIAGRWDEREHLYDRLIEIYLERSVRAAHEQWEAAHVLLGTPLWQLGGTR